MSDWVKQHLGPWGYLAFFVAAYVTVMHILTLDEAIYNIYFERDFIRSQNILSGKLVPYGPELWGGGNTPGPFLYFLNATVLLFSNSIGSLLNFIYLQFGLSLMVLFVAARTYFSSRTAFIAVAVIALNSYLFLDVKYSWNPTEIFLIFSIYLLLILSYVSGHATAAKTIVLGLLVGLGTQIHLTFAFLAISTTVLVLLYVQSGSKAKYLALFLVFAALPNLPHFLYMTFAQDLFIEEILARKYTGYVSYYKGFDPTWSVHAIKTMLFGAPGYLNPHEASFISFFVGDQGPVLGQVQNVFERIAKALVLSVLGALFVVVALKRLRGIDHTAGQSSEAVVKGDAGRIAFVSSCILFAAPLILFYPFLGTDHTRPFHYFYITLLPASLLIGVSADWFLRLTAYAGKMIGSVVALLMTSCLLWSGVCLWYSPVQKKTAIYDYAMTYGDARGVADIIARKSAFSPADFLERVFFVRNGLSQFPALYREVYEARAQKPPSSPVDGVLISRVNDNVQKKMGGPAATDRMGGDL